MGHVHRISTKKEIDIDTKKAMINTWRIACTRCIPMWRAR
jgi:hypothetical protein